MSVPIMTNDFDLGPGVDTGLYSSIETEIITYIYIIRKCKYSIASDQFQIIFNIFRVSFHVNFDSSKIVIIFGISNIRDNAAPT